MGSKVIPKGEESGAKAQNAEFFAADLLPTVTADYASKFKLGIVATAGDAIEVTWDGGSTWELLIGAAELTANKHFEKSFSVRNGDEVNFRCPTSGGITLDKFDVDEVINEG